MIFLKQLPNRDWKLTHFPIGLTALLYGSTYNDVSGSGHDDVTRLICYGLPFGIMSVFKLRITTVHVQDKHLERSLLEIASSNDLNG